MNKKLVSRKFVKKSARWQNRFAYNAKLSSSATLKKVEKNCQANVQTNAAKT
jgi:hypothetical protein